jgi:hypothetical protein
MRKGVGHTLRQLIVGLLVLALLLAPGAQSFTVAAESLHHHDAKAQTIALAGHAAVAPAGHADHGLACGIDCQCAAHAFWLASPDSVLPIPCGRAAVLPWSSDLSRLGVTAHPNPPPPRVIV